MLIPRRSAGTWEPTGLLPPSLNKNHLKTKNSFTAKSSNVRYRWGGSPAIKSQTCHNDPSFRPVVARWCQGQGRSLAYIKNQHNLPELFPDQGWFCLWRSGSPALRTKMRHIDPSSHPGNAWFCTWQLGSLDYVQKCIKMTRAPAVTEPERGSKVGHTLASCF